MGNDRRLRTKIPIRSSRKIAIEGTNTSCDGDKGHQTTQSHPRRKTDLIARFSEPKQKGPQGGWRLDHAADARQPSRRCATRRRRRCSLLRPAQKPPASSPCRRCWLGLGRDPGVKGGVPLRGSSARIRGFPAKATTAFAKVYVNGTSRCGSSISSCPRRATYALLRWSRWRAPLMFKRQSSIWRLTPYVVCANSWPMPELTIRHAAWLGTSR